MRAKRLSFFFLFSPQRGERGVKTVQAEINFAIGALDAVKDGGEFDALVARGEKTGVKGL